MDATILAHQLLLYGHLLFFAVAMATILREDCRLLFSQRIDSAAIMSTARAIKWLLLALWISGSLMVAIDIWLHGGASLAKPKLIAKIAVVCVLTANGVLLHLVAFPILTRPQRNPKSGARIAATLGAVSTTSWLFASFLGTARFIAPYTSLPVLLGLYFVALAGAVAFALVVVSGRLERMLSSDRGEPEATGRSFDPPNVIRLAPRYVEFHAATLH
jgi:hypothetical protein